MQVQQLLRKFQDETVLPVEVNVIQAAVLETSDVDTIEIYDVNADTDNLYGVFTRYRRSPGVYAIPEDVCQIGVAIDISAKWRRLVLAKELMHCFDERDEQSVTEEDIKTLIADISGFDGHADKGHHYHAEALALCVALLVLVPRKARDILLQKFDADEITTDQIANLASIPNHCVAWILSEDYDAVERLVMQPSN